MSRNPSLLVAAVERIAHGDPAREAVVSGDLRLSYRQLADATLTASQALVSAGLRPGMRVAFMGAPGAAFVVSELAVQRAGGVWMGINPKYTQSEIAYCLGDASPSLIIAEASVGDNALARLSAAIGEQDRAVPLQLIEKVGDLRGPLPALHSPQHCLSSKVALLVYTSGTTGQPKGACLTHAGVMRAAELYAARYAHPGLRSLLNLPVNHVGSLIDLTASALVMGGTLVCMPGFEPESIPDIMREERLTLLGQVPAMHLAIEAATAYNPADIASLQHLVWSGSAMPRSWIEKHIEGRAKLSTCYGQTECTGSVTFTKPGAGVDELADTIGIAAEPDLMRIVDSEGREVAAGEPGEIMISGATLMAGYLGRPEASEAAIEMWVAAHRGSGAAMGRWQSATGWPAQGNVQVGRL